MRLRNVSLILLTCVLFQVTLPNTSWLYEAVRVQFVLIAVVLLSLEQDWFAAAMAGVAGGFLMDLLSGGRIGVYALSYGLIGLLIGRVQERLFKENMLTIATVMAVASLLNSLLVSNLLGLYGIPLDYLGQFAKGVLPSAAANAIVGCVAFSMVRRIRRGIRAVQKRYYW
jgi:rod shape-determining protein MreD